MVGWYSLAQGCGCGIQNEIPVDEIDGEILYPIIHLKDNDIEVAITHSDKSQSETYFSFVNGQNTTQGGTHLNAFREAFVKTVREFYNKVSEVADVRNLLSTAISIKVEEPVFESQTKTKLGSNEMGPGQVTVRTFVNDFLKNKLDNFLHKEPETSEALLKKIIVSERERKELSGIQKLARLPPALNDQKADRKSETIDFITEESASDLSRKA
ncbi:hypothetical protein FQR65_LT18550 [Abscondita terminalis]|nr:hypothetical protein FQR65_LT18550 [Abscondita terminalis]